MINKEIMMPIQTNLIEYMVNSTKFNFFYNIFLYFN